MDLNVKIKSKTGGTVTLSAGEATEESVKTSFTFGKGCDNQKELEALAEAVGGATEEA